MLVVMADTVYTIYMYVRDTARNMYNASSERFGGHLFFILSTYSNFNPKNLSFLF